MPACACLRLLSARATHCPAAPAAQTVATNNAHRSNAQELIAKVPIIEVADNVAMCDGGELPCGRPPPRSQQRSSLILPLL